MKAQRLTKLVDEFIAPHFPGYVQKKKVIYKSPLEYVLRGYAFDGGSGGDTLYVSLLIMPLYVPTTYLAGFGSRIVETSVAVDSETSTMQEVLRTMKASEHHVNRLSTPATLAHDKWVLRRNDEYTMEMAAYSLILSGEFNQAEENLTAFRTRLSKMMREIQLAAWLPEMDSRAAGLLTMLNKDPQLAVSQLNDWTEQTKRNLGLA